MAPFENPLLVTYAPHLLYRGFFALPDTIKGADGHPVNALLGSVNQTLWCVERYKPRAVVMCFGQESADYRVEAFPAYHADRPPVPDKLAPQWERAYDFYRALGWSIATDEQLEADELRAFKDIATLRTVELERPPDVPTDYAGGAAAARSFGMNRLAKRLED